MSEKKKEPVKIILSVLKKQVEEGMKKKELAEYYGIPETQMTKALKAAGLKIRKFHLPSFKLVEETEDERQMVIPYEEAEEIQTASVEDLFPEIFEEEPQTEKDIDLPVDEEEEKEEGYQPPFNY